MRKSQAPSLKAKLNTAISGVDKIQNFSKPLKPANHLKVTRDTESVLHLITNSDKIEEEQNDENELQQNESLNNTLLSKLSSETDSRKTQTQKTEPEQDKASTFKNSVANHTIYNVVYGKQTKKKHKTWEENGTLEVTSNHVTLKDEEGKVLGSAPLPKLRKLEEGSRIYVGNKEVELVDLVSKEDSEENIKTENGMLQRTLVTKMAVKPKIKNLNKRFTYPSIKYSSGIALPEPSPHHQWIFNDKALPVSPVYIDESLSRKLRPHQRDGIIFLYECVMGFKDVNITGAILADEMGLGKTLQCIALIWTLLKQGPYGNQPVVKKVLIITPSSLAMNWNNEFLKWLGRIKITPYVVDKKNKPCNINGPVVIISYEMLIRYIEDVEKHKFDLLVCDEGHRLKNFNIRTTQILNRLDCSKRIILTGTPIQNDLQEFYALVHFVNPNVLGTPSEFRRRFEEPILASRQPNSDEEVIDRGKECAQELKRITSKFLLRRTRDLLKNYLPPRHEVVVFCKITEEQKKLYNSVIDSIANLKENLLGVSDGSGHLEAITMLRKICSHPSLLSSENNEFSEIPVIDHSSKVKVTVNFLQELQENSPKEKVVIVSNSTQTLDVLGKILSYLGYCTDRLDGSTPVSQRNGIVDRFNLSNSKSFVFLLSAKAGGVGLNLAGASRLILFDCDWNPATDLQAVSRIWRDGQKYPVFIYRLLTTGTIEERIYLRQISKQGLCEGTVDPENVKSIKLSKEDLKDIFSSCCETEDCLTHDSLFCECSKQGDISISEIELEESDYQLIKQCPATLKISELFRWEHHGHPFNLELLSQLCLKKSEREISFIFRNCKA